MRASSLDVIRGKPLNTVQTPFVPFGEMFEPREVALGYTITRERMAEALKHIRSFSLAPWLDVQDELRIMEANDRRLAASRELPETFQVYDASLHKGIRRWE